MFLDLFPIRKKTKRKAAAMPVDRWQVEKQASLEAIELGKRESLEYLAAERERIVKMPHEEVVKALLHQSKTAGKIETIKSVMGNDLLGVE